MKTWVIFAALAVAVAIFALAADRLAAWFPDWLLLPLAGLAGILLLSALCCAGCCAAQKKASKIKSS